MSHNPYESPKTDVEQNSAENAVPAPILKKIRSCWIAGLVSAGITLIFAFLALFGVSAFGIDEWAFVDAAIMVALVFGVYKKSRTCAILLFVFFAFNKALMWYEAGSVKGLPIALLFFWFFGQGIVGTFQYQKLVQRARA